jgi:hypothetical protein
VKATVQSVSKNFFKNPNIFWQHAGTCCQNMVISEKKILENGATLALFFHEKSFV